MITSLVLINTDPGVTERIIDMMSAGLFAAGRKCSGHYFFFIFGGIKFIGSDKERVLQLMAIHLITTHSGVYTYCHHKIWGSRLCNNLYLCQSQNIWPRLYFKRQREQCILTYLPLYDAHLIIVAMIGILFSMITSSCTDIIVFMTVIVVYFVCVLPPFLLCVRFPEKKTF